MHHRNLGTEVLQVIFSVFLGLVVVAFVGIVVSTVYPEPATAPDIPYDESAHASWRLVTGVWLLVCATLVMVASMLIRFDRVPVIGNGILLGGLFTMIYAVGVALSAPNEWPRLAVVAVALVVTVGLGYWKFAARRTRAVPEPAAAPGTVDAGLTARVDDLEARLDGIRHALDRG
ncbi:MAG TPA: hypothetical protein VFK68_10655 [Propionibacteriaceae bacterium]|nr:hypothetical protein [Propionibacteriaceae bacterium]